MGRRTSRLGWEGAWRAPRARPTLPEQALYRALERLRVAYQPQRWIGPYCADAWLPDRRAVIELDGDCYHRTAAARRRDRRKDRYYQALGLAVWRVRASVFLRDPLGWLRARLDDGRPPVQPPTAGG